MCPPIIDFRRLFEEAARASQESLKRPAPKRPFDSGRSLPRNEGLERAIKTINKMAGDIR